MITIKGKEYTIADLIELRELIEKAVNHLEDEDAIIGTTLFVQWTELLANGYVFTQDDVDAGFKFQYNGVLYKVLQPHTIQTDWTPDTATSLYKKVVIAENGYAEWTQPLGASDAYNIGDIVYYKGTLYKSLIDGNVYPPDTYSAGWEAITL